MGRLLAYQLAEHGSVTLFEQGSEDQQDSASFAAGGMLAPYSELETFDDQLLQLSLSSLELWQQMASDDDFSDLVGFPGTVIVNHAGDGNLHRHLADKWQRFGCGEAFAVLADPASKVPWTQHLAGEGLHVPCEGVVDNSGMMTRLAELARRRGAQLHFNHRVTHIGMDALTVAGPDGSHQELKDLLAIIDTRGIAAKGQLRQLRGVRGEALVLKTRPSLSGGGDWRQQPVVRLLHPRYPIYLIPRPDDGLIIGASTIESEDDGPISVRSLLELLSAAFSVHPGLAEAQVVGTRTGVRAAFDDNLPQIVRCGKVTAVNGLFRHGFLLAPILAQAVVASVAAGYPLGRHKVAHSHGEIMNFVCREDSRDCIYQR